MEISLFFVWKLTSKFFGSKSGCILFFFSKGHPDLHTPGDDINKIIAVKMEKVTRLVFITAWKVANTESKPVADPYN